MTLKGVDTELLEALVRKHFGADFTSRLAWDTLRGRYVPAAQPRRLAVPQKLLGIRVWWKTVGEFSDNLGFRLEVWDPEQLPRARALAEEYNARAEGPRLEVHLCRMPWPASSQPSPA
ncbi:MAG: hypothetical protein ACE147_20720 [Candidatus Methylomirabilales bacterium]